MGTCGQPEYVFRDFCFKQGIEFIIFCLDQGIDVINFCLKQAIFSWTINSLHDSVDQAVNSFVIANGLNKKEFRYIFTSYTGYGFGGMRGRTAPPHQRIYRVTPPPRYLYSLNKEVPPGYGNQIVAKFKRENICQNQQLDTQFNKYFSTSTPLTCQL